MDLPTYIGKITSLTEEFLFLVPITTNAKDQQTHTSNLFTILTLIRI